MTSHTPARVVPRIVVMIGAYNEEAYLAETIPSILSQSMPDFLLLATDNGSTDRTPEILHAFSLADPRVVFVRHAENLSPPVIANTNMRLAHDLAPSTRWFLSHGADDLMEPGYLAAVLEAADHNPLANCIFSPWRWLDHPEKGEKHFDVFDPARCHAVHMLPAWRAITRELWESVGPENEGIRIGADWEWPVRARHALRTVQLERPYLALRVREGGRRSQSDEVDWPRLHGHLCRLTGVEPPHWARKCTPYPMVQRPVSVA